MELPVVTFQGKIELGIMKADDHRSHTITRYINKKAKHQCHNLPLYQLQISQPHIFQLLINK